MDINDILSQCGLHTTTPTTPSPPQTPSTPQEPPQEEEPSTPLSDADLDDILQEHGFNITEEPEEPEENDESENLTDEDYEELEEVLSNEEPVDTTDSTSTTPITPITPQAHSLLPQNSPTLLTDESTSRFSGTEWYNLIQQQRVILAGLGGIGSYCAYNLARMHLASLVLYDDDVVDWSNLSGQFYNSGDIGRSKVSAVEDALRDYTTTTHIYAIKQKFTSSTEAGDIMICGFDNMVARKTFFNAWRAHLEGKSQEERSKCLFLDGRLSISVLQVFCITGDDDYNISRYEHDYLFSDSEADPEYDVCSLKQTTYMASMIGALMTNLFTNFVANLLSPVIPYTLPFFTEYDAQYMIFKEVN